LSTKTCTDVHENIFLTYITSILTKQLVATERLKKSKTQHKYSKRTGKRMQKFIDFMITDNAKIY